MKVSQKLWLGLLAGIAAVTVTSIPASAQQPQKPNILFIMGDGIGWMQPSIYHRGLMVGETPNIDRIGNEGAIFMEDVAMQSCTSGRNAFFTGMYPLRTGMIPPQLPGSPSYLRPGTPTVAKFLLDLGYTTGEFGKNHRAIDRIGRSLIDLLGTIQHLEACGVDLYLDQQAIDTTTPSGKLMFQVTGAFAEFERAMIRQRIHAGLRRAVANGKTLGRPLNNPKALEKARQALGSRMGINKVARQVGLSNSTVARLKAEMAAPA